MTKPHYTLTTHTWKRVQQMGLTRADVLSIIEDPEIDYYSKDRRVACKGEYAVVYNPETHAVVTVLYRTFDEYVRPEAERLQWAGEPEVVLNHLVTVAALYTHYSADERVLITQKVLAYFGIPCDIITVTHATPISGRVFMPVAIVAGQLVDLPHAFPLKDEFWLGHRVSLGGITYQYQPNLVTVIDWTITPNEVVALLQELVYDKLKLTRG